MLTRRRWAWALAVAGIVLIQPASALLRHSMRGTPAVALFNESGWDAQTIRDLPTRVTALATFYDERNEVDHVFVGTERLSAVYRLSVDLNVAAPTQIAEGLGDSSYGWSDVSCLAITDLDDDGTPELLVETSQIDPIGRPRLYIWSIEGPPYRTVARGVARPDIESSWSHGLGVWRPSGSHSTHIFSTFCGHGEIVEYKFAHESATSGFAHDNISWRQVGKLAASGEDVTVVDADNDGAVDLCLATGFEIGKAAIVVHQFDDRGVEQSPRHVIDESGRFGNVRFVVGDLGDGANEVVAWWCTDLCSGDAEVIRYRLGPEGIRDRAVIARGKAGERWPRDGQFSLADTDGDGRAEVWFVTGSGKLSCYRAGADPALSDVAIVRGELGPITRGHGRLAGRDSLYVGSGRSVLRIERTDGPHTVAGAINR